MRMQLVIFAIGLAVVPLGELRAEENVRPQVDGLIARLGSESFAEREAAEKRLIAMGDELLANRNFSEDGDLSEFERFHFEFILPLAKAARSNDAETRRRAATVLHLFTPGRPIGSGVSGWALYQLHRLMPKLPPELSPQALSTLLTEKDLEEQNREEFINRQRNELRLGFDRMAVTNMAHNDPGGTADWLIHQDTRWSKHLDAVVGVWAKRDFEAAVAWSNTVPITTTSTGQPNYGMRHNAIQTLIVEWPEDKSISQAAERLSLMNPEWFDGQHDDSGGHCALPSPNVGPGKILMAPSAGPTAYSRRRSATTRSLGLRH